MILAVLCVFFNHIHCHQTCWNSNLSSVRHLAPFGISQCHLKHLLLTHQTVWKWKEQQLNINWLQFPKATIEEEEAKCEEKETEKPKAEAAHNPLLILHLVTSIRLALRQLSLCLLGCVTFDTFTPSPNSRTHVWLFSGPRKQRVKGCWAGGWGWGNVCFGTRS